MCWVEGQPVAGARRGVGTVDQGKWRSSPGCGAHSESSVRAGRDGWTKIPLLKGLVI